jgi:hypothetical protein
MGSVRETIGTSKGTYDYSFIWKSSAFIRHSSNQNGLDCNFSSWLFWRPMISVFAYKSSWLILWIMGNTFIFWILLLWIPFCCFLQEVWRSETDFAYKCVWNTLFALSFRNAKTQRQLCRWGCLHCPFLIGFPKPPLTLIPCVEQ